MRTERQWIAVFVAALIVTVSVGQLHSHGQSLPANVWVVDQDAGSDSNSGQDDWENAFETLQKALDEVDEGDQIWVATSVDPYVPNVGIDPNTLPFFASPHTTGTNPDQAGRMLTFQLPKNVGIYGGFLGNAHPSGGEDELSDADPVNNVTILSGELGSAGVGDNAYHVIFYFQSALDNVPPNPAQMIVDGFTITAGNADGGSNTSTQGGLNAIGGGVLIVFEAHFEWYADPEDELDAHPDFAEPEGPVFSRCVFENNYADLAGGAIAGIYNGGRIVDCTFITNEQVSTTDGDFGSRALRGGGAINVLGPVAVLKSTFIENESVAVGGAVHHSGIPGAMPNTSTVVISNCTFQENTAPTGGGVHSLPGPVVNCLFVGNSATGTGAEGGGAIDIEGGIHGCTFVANSADGLGGGASNGPPVSNNIFWKNTSGEPQPTPAWRAQVEMSDSLANDYNLIED